MEVFGANARELVTTERPVIKVMMKRLMLIMRAMIMMMTIKLVMVVYVYVYVRMVVIHLHSLVT